jgi:glycogen debranching enzyme
MRKFGVGLEPVEDSNPAKTMHTILKRPAASWSHSVYSVPFAGKIIPNRDYPYEGLSYVLDGRNHHILDGIAIGIDGHELKPSRVLAYPWKVIYSYSGDVKLDVDYYLLGIRGNPGRIIIRASEPCTLEIEPLVDIRWMYDHSDPSAHRVEERDNGLLFSRDGIRAAVVTSSPCECQRWHHPVGWFYKMGSGYREEVDGKIVFRGEQREPVSLGTIRIADQKTSVIAASCGRSEDDVIRMCTRALADYAADERSEAANAKRIVELLDLSGAAAFRALGMAKFGMYLEDTLSFEAGDLWFRTLWFRDCFEGILQNMNTLFKLGMENRIRDILVYAFDRRDVYGRIPNFGDNYDSIDATLLAFIVGSEYLRRRRDDNLKRVIIGCADDLLTSLESGDLAVPNGPPVLHQNGLVSSAPHHSWTDGMRSITAGGISLTLPIRVPEDWACETVERCGAKAVSELAKPEYFLPEVNAQWIRAVKLVSELSGEKRYSDILDMASSGFRSVFLNEHFLNNLVTTDGRVDANIGSPAMVAISIADFLFTDKEVRVFMNTIKEHLLVRRAGLAFGVAVRESEKKIYYGDSEYHECVVWPRDTPYLIRLLRRNREQRLVKEIIRSNLYHQMKEGFLFYNSELFSQDDGIVPVKNPVQFWSQWVDDLVG